MGKISRPSLHESFHGISSLDLMAHLGLQPSDLISPTSLLVCDPRLLLLFPLFVPFELLTEVRIMERVVLCSIHADLCYLTSRSELFLLPFGSFCCFSLGLADGVRRGGT
jgi:hypothetical protein